MIAEKWLVFSSQNREEIVDSIEILRRRLEYLVNTKSRLDDPEILATSQDLDLALNEYYRWLESYKNIF